MSALEVGADSGGREAFAPRGGGVGGQLLDGDVLAAGVGGVDPGREVRGAKIGEGQCEVAHVSLGIDDQGGDAREQRFLEEDDAEAGLARAGHADDDAVGGEMVRGQLESGVGAPAVLQDVTEVEVAHVGR